MNGFLLLLSCIFALQARAVPPPEGETIRIQISDSGIKPWMSFNDGDARTTFNSAVHGLPLIVGPDLSIEAGYIKSWKWIAPEQKFIFALDPDLRYHDGRDLQAEDFELVLIKAFISPEASSNESVPLHFIKGSQKLKKGMRFRSGMLEGVKITGPKTLEVSLTGGLNRFLYALGPLLPPLAPRADFREDLYSFHSLPVGSGPYKLVYSDPRSSMVRVERVSPKGGPRFIEFYSEKIAWENNADLALGGGISRMKTYMNQHPASYRRLQGLLPDSIEILTFNYQNEAAKNQDFRRAVALAIDRQQEIPGFSAQNGTDQIIPHLSYGFQPPQLKFDRDEARRIFKTLPQSIRKAEHILLCHGAPGSDPGRYYEFIRDSLLAIGMKVKLVLAEETEVRTGAKQPTFLVFGRYVDSDPLTSFAHYLPGASHQTLPENASYAETFRRAEATTQIEDKARLIAQLSRELTEKTIVLPLHQRFPVYYLSPRLKSAGLGDRAWTFDPARIEFNR